MQAGLEPIVIYVDTLDECNDEDVRNIVTAFEHSAAVAIENGADVNICCSSRHYPHIKVSKSLELRMESQNAADIALYVHNALKDRNAKTSDFDLEGEIVRKANGVFLWVIFVIHRLWNAANYEQTSKEKMHILKQIPSELDGMFSLILDTVEEKYRHETLLFFQWILLASHPLTLKEFRYAIAFSSERPPSSIKFLKESDVFLQGDKALASLIRDRSGGLLEVTQAVIDNSVQFIHESVRDFLTSGTGLGILGLTGRDDFARGWHEHLKRACIAFLKIDELRTVPSVRLMGSSIHKLISKISNASNRLESLQDQGKPNEFRTAQAALPKPFTRYAIQNWVFHAHSAELAGESQASFLPWARLGSFEQWTTLADTNERANLGVWMREATNLQSKERLFHIACELDLHTCIAPLIENGVDPVCKV